jgi:hypothetical protein
MKKQKHVSGFYFGKAEYRIEDKSGNSLLVKINYRKRNYDLVVLRKNGKGLSVLKNKASSIAKDLLKRKSKVNFAKNN